MDRLVEWPAQRELLGRVNGLSVLDAGCGNGGRIAELVRDGATASVGVDISDNFITRLHRAWNPSGVIFPICPRVSRDGASVSEG